ncbi:MAG: DMT family transporter [Alphaproteobacteria bacterium]|nr:DMT family transporter [Alphaproteobacteria bacterium]
MISSLSPRRRGILFAILGYTAFALSDANSKWLVRDFDNIQIIVTLNALAALLLMALNPLLGGWKGLWVPRELPFHAIRTLFNFIFLLLIVYSLSILPLAGIYTMIFAKPFFAALLAMAFYGERVGLKRWAAIIGGFAGVLVILRPGFGDASLSLLIPLAGAFLIAVMFTVCRSLKESSPFVMSFYPILGTALLGLPFLLSGHYVEPDLWQWVHFGIGAVMTTAGITFISMAFRLTDASVVAPFLYSEMIWGILFGIFLFHDTSFDLWMLGGTGLIIASGFYLMRLKDSAAGEASPSIQGAS